MAVYRTYGEHLPDQVDRIASLSNTELELISEVRDIYKERALLEKEYAGKLQVLAKKAADKKAKRMASLVVGDEPTKLWTEDSLRKSTLDYAYAELVASLDHAVQDHSNLSDALTSQVVEAAKGLERQHDEIKKKQDQFYQKILADRDKVYNERIKLKQKYDEECLEVESYRQKQGRAQDDRHASRAAKQFEQQQVDMLNGKNSYLISTTIANKLKAKFYAEDLPALENQFQHVQGNMISRLVSLLQHAQSIHAAHLTTLQSRVSAVQTALGAVDVPKDQDLFIDHNIRPFTAPGDWGFEPCAGYYDTGEMSVDAAPKVFLQNKLSRCRTKLGELTPLMEAKKREVEKLSKVISAYTNDRGLGDSDAVSDNYIDSQHQLTLLTSSACALTAEIDTIVSSLGDDEGAQQPHAFKAASFSIPTTCGYCKSSIWGLSKQGKTCKLCGLSVHSKCELKVPAECGGARASRIPSTTTSLSRTDSRASSIQAAPTPSSFAQPHPVAEESHLTGRVVYSFTPTSPFELAVSEGTSVQVLEEDDGSGWVKVADQNGGRGLVPASYVELVEDDEPPPPRRAAAPAVAPSPGSGTYVRSVYAYEAQGADELSLQEGQMVELSAGPSGGQNYADGWWEGFDARGKKGIFPSNYVELA